MAHHRYNKDILQNYIYTKIYQKSTVLDCFKSTFGVLIKCIEHYGIYYNCLADTKTKRVEKKEWRQPKNQK